MANFYCEYCGLKASSVSTLTSNKCTRHPNGFCKGNHKLYEGSEKSQYTCKYCGQNFRTIQALTGSRCTRHPNGYCKGNHAPAL